jgi:hypothetical protein
MPLARVGVWSRDEVTRVCDEDGRVFCPSCRQPERGRFPSESLEVLCRITSGQERP